MKLIFLLFLFTINSYSQIFHLNHDLHDNSHMPFITHTGPDNSFQNALAFNIEYDQIKQLRKEIEKHIGTKLNFLTSWNKEGEAHVTTITPPEYRNILSPYLSMARINELAQNLEIQRSDLKILGLGMGEKEINGKVEKTFFIIVDSMNLRKIRHQIYQEYLLRGGPAERFDPTWFFPHITIGYTKRDLHEKDGIIKNLKHSFYSQLIHN
ncbi:hypothetical protein HBN50_10925 [Halobacteriovorax sp. GB3]|uniref:hypothetical protein n=1 Tax=Halobacteriovorax sp. GB3 TaxID=2719615 RepID=UPI00235FE662|nr:hypothetical protein [Halobacteriovorax sp. GB3]MDD0853616.1 hypothetical protein [Halobacteriovorax sp. GB3]